MKNSVPLCLLMLSLSGAAARAEVHCAEIFGDHMVLQRDRAVPIWGTAAPAESVTVDFAGQQVATRADAEGRWQVQLAAMPASAEPRMLSVIGSNQVHFSDVLVGEVWLCSGQSNMEKPLGPRSGQKPTDDYEAEIAQANYPRLRLYQMPQYGKPQAHILGLQWVPCSPAALRETNFSAAGYYFGRELWQQLGVPIGMIHSSFGGTQIEAWIPPAAFSTHPAIEALRNVKYQAWVSGVQATELYESMIAPLAPYAVRGFLWYQGESNVMQADGDIYTAKMQALIDGWRATWHEPDAPWYFVQIAPFDYSKWDKFPKLLTAEELPVFWEAQEHALAIPHTGMIPTTDLVANLHDIHPTNKRDVGVRLARLALADTYGRKIIAQAPVFAGLEKQSNGRLRVRFKNAASGLKTRDGRPPSDFSIAGADRKFVPADATIVGDSVVVGSAAVPEPVAVRFAWSETATPNLENVAGLPAFPFRTDSWPVARERPAMKPEEAPTKKEPK